MSGPTRIDQKNLLFVAVPKNKANEGKIPYLSAAGWTTSAEALDWGKQQQREYGKRFALKTELKNF